MLIISIFPVILSHAEKQNSISYLKRRSEIGKEGDQDETVH